MKLWSHKYTRFITSKSQGKNDFNVVYMIQSIFTIGRRWWLSPKCWLCECIESNTSLWPKVSCICINHWHCMACAHALFMRCLWTCHFALIPIPKFLYILFFLVHEIKECVPKLFFLMPFVVAIQGYISNILGRI